MCGLDAVDRVITIMRLGAGKMHWRSKFAWTSRLLALRKLRFPILSDLSSASWPNWRESFKELFVILFFSLMPLWLGLLIVTISTITDGPSSFIGKFASSSDLGILSASLLGPLLYMMFREEGESTGDRLVPRFPSGLWFIMIILACCIVATMIYALTYLSGTHAFYDRNGLPINFINAPSVALTSWILFVVVILVILFAATIRNSTETEPPRMMSADTQNFVDRFAAAQGEKNEPAARHAG
jgi:hypothetical protein